MVQFHVFHGSILLLNEIVSMVNHHHLIYTIQIQMVSLIGHNFPTIMTVDNKLSKLNEKMKIA